MIAVGMRQHDMGGTRDRGRALIGWKHWISVDPWINQQDGLFDFNAKAGMPQPDNVHDVAPMMIFAVNLPRPPSLCKVYMWCTAKQTDRQATQQSKHTGVHKSKSTNKRIDAPREIEYVRKQEGKQRLDVNYWLMGLPVIFRVCTNSK